LGGQDSIASGFEEHRAHLRALAAQRRRGDRQPGRLVDHGGVADLPQRPAITGRAPRGAVRRPAAGAGDRCPAGSIAADPEQEALLADGVGLGLLIVLETLTPAERLAFVLHDVFAIPFDELATMLERSPEAARRLASRARRRVRHAAPQPDVGRRAPTSSPGGP